MLKKILKYLFYGISWGCTFFVLTNLIGVITVGNTFLQPLIENFPKQALGAILAGICCGSTAIVYTFEKLPLWKQITIHYIVGLTGYFICAFKLGWMPIKSGLYLAVFITIGIIIFTGIWCCFYLYNRYEARKVNERLKEMEGE